MPRSSRNPLPVLAAIALIPALLLGAAWRFADGRASDNSTPWDQPASSLVLSDATSTTTSSLVPAVVPTAVPLATPLLSARRTPALLARDINLAQFVTAITNFAQSSLQGSDCLAVAVDGVPVYAQNSTAAVAPASNVKLITATVALDVLGPDFVFTTTVAGANAGGVVTGDLFLVGGGDPLLAAEWWQGTSPKFPQFNSTSIETLADQVVAAGITQVTGGVAGDASIFDDEWYAPTWSEGVRFADGGPISGLVVSDSRLSPTESANDPVIGAARIFQDLLAARGVTFGGSPSQGIAPQGSTEITSISSKPLTDILAELLVTSDNTTAEHIIKTLGLVSGTGATREAGLAVVNQWLVDNGVPVDGFLLVDGSGLSDENQATCAGLLATLQAGSPNDAVGLGLPVGGAVGGTLLDVFLDGPMTGVLRAKTGTLNDDCEGGRTSVKALTGYVPLEGGGTIEFAMVLNRGGGNSCAATRKVYRPIWEALGQAFATYGEGGVSATALAPR
jgi:serine-type D-Ala-D-Ala carboxypeptidase/endopeptidase (penicillin-binding protein 4)